MVAGSYPAAVAISSLVKLRMGTRREYFRMAVAEFRRQMKIKAVDYLGGKCIKCGYFKCMAAMEFHHRDPSQKDFRISNGRSIKWERVVKELDKCDLLCSNCHKEMHYELNLSRIKEYQRKLSEFKKPKGSLVLCAYCNKEIYKIPSQMKYALHFCNKICQNMHQAHRLIVQEKGRKIRTIWPINAKLRLLVWKKPMTTISKQLGVSDKAVKKHCDKRGIPTPGPGYWAKKASESHIGDT